ncbi:FG-GAP-like repeat-containing protein [Rhodopirellula sp. MGV]|uniref:FG-GAP-like repeat-containing protein n=1 Tax=Rhodopirellula sp. MGV TaxID=2023130 RepID=UPI000B96EDBB|nr:FG-GAP-like repeat-containing protein [Rhodopirellula sp. MGV]OYP38519.1 hypothetical protein CGZ80_01865 [Rhodopirellula sp. MGV]PNY34837.1 tetratricopeptide repeat protein [Rhodopirellula baltica]
MPAHIDSEMYSSNNASSLSRRPTFLSPARVFQCLCLGILLTQLGCHSESAVQNSNSSIESSEKNLNIPSQSGPEAKTPSIAEIEHPQEAKGELSREERIDRAISLSNANQLKAAESQLEQLLLLDPDDAEVIFRLANLKAQQGNLDAGVELLDAIPSSHPQAGLAAIGQSADWCMDLQRYQDAENRYRKVLQLAGDVPVVHRQLAHLYNRQGRRHEAAVHLRTLCRLGNIQERELHSLFVLGHAIFDDPNAPAEMQTGRDAQPFYPIGPAATARMLYTANRHVEALEALEESVHAGFEPPSIVAFYGLLCVEAQSTERFGWWLSHIGPETKEFAEYWAAIGAYLVSEGRYQEAVRALGEALRRDPTNIGAMRRINQSLEALGETELAERWISRFDVQRDVVSASNQATDSTQLSPEAYETIADGLDQLERPLEAVTWRLFGAFRRNAPKQEVESLNQQRTALLKSPEAFPDPQECVCNIDIDSYPMAYLGTAIVAATETSEERDAEDYQRPRFKNVASEVGLEHTYDVASKPQPYQFALYQSLGGGVAVLDYDLDGAVDLYFAQGGADPPDFMSDSSNILYRHQDTGLVDCTQASHLSETRYTIGVGSGDWNQDGFPDLVIANIEQKVLLINNGDGTFHSTPFGEDPTQSILTSSIAFGDVTGDALPDLYAVHYVNDHAMVDKPLMGDDGNVLTISPASFRPGIDVISINDGNGGFEHQPISESDSVASTGLGVVIADWDNTPGNEVFVGNDIRANQLWKLQGDTHDWVDIAPISGCALDAAGVETASMGIAVADFDGNGQRDIHITNFYLESVSLFMNRGGTFQDQSVKYRLQRDSSNVLGFGCQAIDYNLDGRPDLAITNGNIEIAPDEPLQQPPQFFVNLGGQFRLADVDDATGYFAGKYLGRSLARLDFNADGRQDIVVSHIGSPSALLINETETRNHWLNVELTGTASERDAIGAQVEIRVGQEVLTNWIVGGDGYLCHNQSMVPFGLGKNQEPVQVTVTWPSGVRQIFDAIAVDQAVRFIEGQTEPATSTRIESAVNR